MGPPAGRRLGRPRRVGRRRWRWPAGGRSWSGRGSDRDVPGLSAFITAGRDFCRVDTAIFPPRVDPHQWRLRIGGMVDHPFQLSYDQLLAMPMEEHDITLVCVSNEVGDRLSGNARWRGVRLDELLRRAGPQPG